MCSKRNELNKQIMECRSQLSNVCPSVLLRCVCECCVKTCFGYAEFHEGILG